MAQKNSQERRLYKMELGFSSLLEEAPDTVMAACDNSGGGCDSGGCDICQSGCQGGTDGCDGT